VPEQDARQGLPGAPPSSPGDPPGVPRASPVAQETLPCAPLSTGESWEEEAREIGRF